MSKPRMGAPKRVAVSLLAGALAVFGIALAAPQAGAAELPQNPAHAPPVAQIQTVPSSGHVTTAPAAPTNASYATQLWSSAARVVRDVVHIPVVIATATFGVITSTATKHALAAGPLGTTLALLALFLAIAYLATTANRRRAWYTLGIFATGENVPDARAITNVIHDGRGIGTYLITKGRSSRGTSWLATVKNTTKKAQLGGTTAIPTFARLLSLAA